MITNETTLHQRPNDVEEMLPSICNRMAFNIYIDIYIKQYGIQQ